MNKFSVKSVKRNIINILRQENVPLQDAKITADVLLEGDLKNRKNHGINRLTQILEGFVNKTVNPTPKPKIIVDFKAIAVIDGNYGLGYPLGKKAMEICVKKAKKYGISMVGVINSSHLGVMSYYSEIASNKGLIGIAMTTSSPAVVLTGGKKKTLGTNPFSYSIPYKPHAFTADFSTASLSRGEVYGLLKAGLQLPKNKAVDKEGNPTTNPQKALEGGLLAFGNGENKGLFFSILISILCGPVIGGQINTMVAGTRHMNEKPNKGDIFIAIDFAKTSKKDVFSYKLNTFAKEIKSQKVNFRIPNEKSHMIKKHNMKYGIEVSQNIVELFRRFDYNGKNK